MSDYDSEANADDSPFISAADFFSLLSLTLILIAIGLTDRHGSAIKGADVAFATRAHDGEPVPITRDTALVELQPDGDRLKITVSGAGSPPQSAHFPIQDDKISIAAYWLEEKLLGYLELKKAVFYLPNEDMPDGTHRAFHLLVQDVMRRHRVIIAYAAPEDKDDGFE